MATSYDYNAPLDEYGMYPIVGSAQVVYPSHDHYLYTLKAISTLNVIVNILHVE